MKVTITTKPTIESLRDKFGRLPGKITDAIEIATKKGAYVVEAESKKRTPVDTGRLRSSIFTTIYKKYAVVEPKTNYALAVHEGTKFTKARPYMKEGAENAGKEINEIFQNEIQKVLVD